MEVYTDRDRGRQADGEKSEQIRQLAMDGCCDSSESEQGTSCFEMVVWTDGCLCANYRLSA